MSPETDKESESAKAPGANRASTDQLPAIGFIGMGHMGSHMAQRLLAHGYRLSVYNRTREKAQAVGRLGAEVADSPRQLASQSDVVMVSVTDDSSLTHVMLGPDGAFSGLVPGSTVIDLSTVYPTTSQLIYAAARDRGASMIDAAVSGSVPQVDEGKLVIFVGGEKPVFERCRPILDILGSSVFYMGASGMGTTMKMVVNTLLGVGMQALAEAIAMGAKAGLNKDLLLEVLGQTAVLTAGQKAKLENVKKEQYPTEFALSLMYKDFGLILRQAAEASVPMPAAAVAQQMYSAAIARGKRDDFSVAIQFMEEMAGLQVPTV